MTSKYAADIATIKADVQHLVKGMDKMNDSQGKQWERINENEGNIKVLNTKVSVFAGIQLAVSTALAAAAGWFGTRR